MCKKKLQHLYLYSRVVTIYKVRTLCDYFSFA